jgi:hypothetical protein
MAWFCVVQLSVACFVGNFYHDPFLYPGVKNTTVTYWKEKLQFSAARSLLEKFHFHG